MTIQYSHYGLPNTPPYFVDEQPTDTVKYNTHITVSIYDDRGAVDINTFDLNLLWYEGGGGEPIPQLASIVINGVIQSGYSGTITPNEYNGYDVDVMTEAPLGWGDNFYTVMISVYDDLGAYAEDSWTFESLYIASVVRVQAIARYVIEVELDLPVRIREVIELAEPPSDKYTPIEWGGASTDGANPENFTIDNIEDGALSGEGESVSLIPTWIEEHPDHAYISSGYVWSSHIWVHTDYQMTARAEYEIEVSNLISNISEMLPDQGEFLGYVVSQVPRQSLILMEQLPAIIRRWDDDGTGDLAKFFGCVQETFNRLVEDIDAFFPDLCEIDRIRYEWLDTMLYDLGNPFAGKLILTINEKRKLCSLLVQMYREKGTCVGIRNAVRVFTGVELTGCSNAWDGDWVLGDGTYPTSYGGSELGYDTILGPGDDEIWYFWLYHPTPGSITADELSRIAVIANYMKPAGMRYLGVTAP